MGWESRLTQEKSLFQIYKIARLAAYSKFNNLAAICTFIFLVLCFGANAYFGEPITSASALVEGVSEVADIGFTFTTAILGFLISGFAIFVGISKPEILIILARTDREKFNISELQFIFFNFMLVFIHYLVFLLVCVVLKATSYTDGPLGRIITLIYEANSSAGRASISTIFAVMLSWLIFIALLLKSFIWNLYQAMLITILLEAEMSENETSGKDE